MPDRPRRLLIGLSPRIMRDLPREFGFRGKTLQYLEQSVAHWVADGGALVVMLPTIETGGEVTEHNLSVRDYVDALDGLVLQGGADIDPGAYDEVPGPWLQSTDVLRDRFELRLLRGFADAGKPVLGICRGMQLINVAYGGSLHQDLIAAAATTQAHVSPDYDAHSHPLRCVAGGWLASLYPASDSPQVNSIHHQGIARLGAGLRIEAWSDDGIVECVRGTGATFVLGVQWHPEFHDARFPHLLDAAPLRDAFLGAAQARRDTAERDAGALA